MNIVSALGFFVGGICLGWFIRAFTMVHRLQSEALANKNKIPKFEKFAQDMKHTDAVLQSEQAYADRFVLTRLDVGNISDAKAYLIHRLGMFYHDWLAKPAGEIPEPIKSELEALKTESNNFKSVQAVVAHPPPKTVV